MTPNWLQHSPQQVVFPDPQKSEECKLSFKDHQKEHPLNWYLVCDFESFLTPTDEDADPDAATHLIDERKVSGFWCYRVTDVAQYQTPQVMYSGPDVMDHFYEHVISESKTINEVMSRQIPLSPMSKEDYKRHRSSEACANCKCPFTHQNHKVRHHSHLSGEYLFAACNNCNLQLKPKKCQANAYFLPIIFHNGNKYDLHFVIKHFRKQYVEKSRQEGQKS